MVEHGHREHQVWCFRCDLSREEAKQTPEQFARNARQLREDLADDPEAAHGAADDLMEEVLEALGYGEGVKVIRRLVRWYA